MTWINDIKQQVKKDYNIEPRIVENYQTRYKKYHHRAAFRFEIAPGEPSYSWSGHDWQSSGRMARGLRDAMGDNVRIRNEWTETFVYFNDLTVLLDAVPRQYQKSLIRLEIMQPEAVAAKQNFTHDYPVELSVRKQLPYNRYRYRIHLAGSGKIRKSIGESNLAAIYDVLKAYEGIQISSKFSRYATRAWYLPDTYFYAETLDWLPIIYIMEPRYIKRIEQFITTKEIHNETTA
jgi:hypothetical protein